MSKVNTEKFVTLVKRSGLATEEEFSQFFSDFADRSNEPPPEDAQQLANLLVEAGLLNQWQADNLLKGKHKGFMLGKYRLQGHLGTGGMSSVYLARHPVMERLVAIKVLPQKFVKNENYVARFKREAKAAAALDHPNIVRAYDVDQDGDSHYIVMEYIDGRDLQRIVKEDGPLSADDAADCIAQAALGLQHSHEAGLIHRDVKPANCLVDLQHQIKLLDMGLAKFSETVTGSLSEIFNDSVVGTADYLAPEQARNSQTVDSRADIYSLGCTLYFLLTGQPPFPQGSITERLLKHQKEEPQSIYELRRDAPPALVDLCRRMMTKSADERIQSAHLVAQEIAGWLKRRGVVFHGENVLDAYNRQKASANAADGNDQGGRFGRNVATAPGPAPATRPGGGSKNPGETISSANDDTSRIGTTDSSLNDDLTLAPLDDDSPSDDTTVRGTKRKSVGSGLGPTGSSSVISDRPSAGSSVVTSGSGSSIEDDLPIKTSSSRPLDELLKDPNFAKRIQIPTAQLSGWRRESFWPKAWPWLVGGVVLVIVAVVAAIVVMTSGS